jgi:hypothetical protein
MNARIARALIPLHRPGRADADSPLAKAVRFAERDAELVKALAGQREFDNSMLEVIRAIPLPDAVRKRLDEAGRPGTKRLDWREAIRQPVFASIFVGLAVLVGLLVHFGMEKMSHFPGKENVVEMIESDDSLTGNDFERIETPAGNLGDWFMLHSLDRYDVPPEFAQLKTAGCRIFKQDGHPVAQIALPKPGAEVPVLFHIFRAADFGVEPAPQQWVIFEERFGKSQWVAAVRGYGENCLVIAFRGEKPEMEKFLARSGKR